ncbi:MAG TPA: hypothetical protein VNY05_10520 [Candidatus Acidoferrales bacterium]|jgi:hypothetical protein|nr:hypothetical protein [Candidatus Acidoferrales bacterium]
MSVDLELEAWRQEWQSAAAEPPAAAALRGFDLRRKVERQSRWMRLALAMDCLVTVVIGGGVIVWAARSAEADTVSLVLATWVFLAAAWAFVLAGSSGNWSPASQDTAQFLDLSIRRARAAIAATVFQTVLFWTEMVFCLGWIYRHNAVRQPVLMWLLPSSISMGCVWLASLAFSAFIVWFRRRKRSELECLMEVRNQADDSGGRQELRVS